MPESRPTRKRPESLRLRDVAPGFTVKNLAQSIAFYVDGLGFTVDQRWETGGELRGVMLKAGRCRIGLSQDDFAKGSERVKGLGMSIWLTTAQDLETLVARLKQNGISLSQELEEMPWGGSTFALEDPDGFKLTFKNEG